MSNDNSLSRPELDDRIAQQREELDRLTKERDALLKK